MREIIGLEATHRGDACTSLPVGAGLEVPFAKKLDPFSGTTR